ncbi:TPA: DUF3696 domain-containing protein [Pseudomonas aeruginosa]|nr:DUF3696 domain-containing protein [Pseudomonas aeruginosa]HCF5273144.1 DUF3696 domain-containing protein [Pseudomonas aeruginosa]HCF7348512.1 DUF3696 domain-containing protein [Pseudomonas aeruginosa]
MLARLYLNNFKSINMEHSIELAPYSILCGANSSGKSSIIQAILLLCQTFGGRFQTESLILNGNLTRLGSFHDIKRHRTDNEPITISFTITPRIYTYEEMTISCEIIFGRTQRQKTKLEDDYHPDILSIKCQVITKNEGIEQSDYMHVRQPKSGETTRQEYYVVEHIELSKDSKLEKDYPNYKILGCQKNQIIPSELIIEYDYTKKLSQHIAGIASGDRQPSHRLRELGIEEDQFRLPKCFFEKLKSVIHQELSSIESSLDVPKEILDLFTRDLKARKITLSDIKKAMTEANFSLTPDIINEKFLQEESSSLSDWKLFLSQLDRKNNKQIRELIDKYRTELQEAWYQGVPIESKREIYEYPAFSHATMATSFYFSRSVKYLGPLRNEPQAIYTSIGLIDTSNVGLKGEYTAATLHQRKDEEITYYSPKGDGTHLIFEARRSSLKEACQDWLSYLGVVEEFHTRDKGKLGYELYVKTSPSEEWQDLTHVGVGVSQVLPIILMFLLSRKGDVLIFEQPELHLHPKIQSRLCDLFLVMAQTGTQCIIETHSEYLINRLRLRIAQDKTDQTQSCSSIYFISKRETGSVLDEVSINKYGAIIEWPKDFFDQTDREVERILIEASKKKKLEKTDNARNR